MFRLIVKRTFAAAPAAPAAKKGKAKKVKESKLGNTLTPDGKTGFRVGEKVPINIYKAETDPVIKPDSEYPDWLFTSVINLPSLADCVEIIKKDRAEGFLPSRDISQRYVRMKRLLLIRKNNEESTQL